jgi:uncharacterized protein
MKNILTVRTVTAYLNFKTSDFPITPELLPSSRVSHQVALCVQLLREMEQELSQAEYTVQTVRLATNPFGEWLYPEKDSDKDSIADRGESIQSRLAMLDSLLANHGIEFCALGCATTSDEARSMCPIIVATSGRFSCSAAVTSDNVDSAMGAAETILTISQLGGQDDASAPAFLQGGLGNFRFCAAASCQPFIPFFPAAKSDSSIENPDRIRFAVGLENGVLFRTLLAKCQSIGNIRQEFSRDMADALLPIQTLCDMVSNRHAGMTEFVGIDSSLNPSLDEAGSVAQAMEQLNEIRASFGGPGTLAAAAEITKALQNLPGIKLTGYCGLMLPVCEDRRLAALATAGATTTTGAHANNDIIGSEREFRITDLLSISSVCGVGVDTVPIPGDSRKEEIASLILDVAGIAGRWNKSLSCRVFPVPGKKAGEMTEFDSPYLVNAAVFALR